MKARSGGLRVWVQLYRPIGSSSRPMVKEVSLDPKLQKNKQQLGYRLLVSVLWSPLPFLFRSLTFELDSFPRQYILSLSVEFSHQKHQSRSNKHQLDSFQQWLDTPNTGLAHNSYLWYGLDVGCAREVLFFKLSIEPLFRGYRFYLAHKILFSQTLSPLLLLIYLDSGLEHLFYLNEANPTLATSYYWQGRYCATNKNYYLLDKT